MPWCRATQTTPGPSVSAPHHVSPTRPRVFTMPRVRLLPSRCMGAPESWCLSGAVQEIRTRAAACGGGPGGVNGGRASSGDDSIGAIPRTARSSKALVRNRCIGARQGPIGTCIGHGIRIPPCEDILDAVHRSNNVGDPLAIPVQIRDDARRGHGAEGRASGRWDPLRRRTSLLPSSMDPDASN